MILLLELNQMTNKVSDLVLHSTEFRPFYRFIVACKWSVLSSKTLRFVCHTQNNRKQWRTTETRAVFQSSVFYLWFQPMKLTWNSDQQWLYANSKGEKITHTHTKKYKTRHRSLLKHLIYLWHFMGGLNLVVFCYLCE